LKYSLKFPDRFIGKDCWEVQKPIALNRFSGNVSILKKGSSIELQES